MTEHQTHQTGLPKVRIGEKKTSGNVDKNVAVFK